MASQVAQRDAIGAIAQGRHSLPRGLEVAALEQALQINSGIRMVPHGTDNGILGLALCSLKPILVSSQRMGQLGIKQTLDRGRMTDRTLG